MAGETVWLQRPSFDVPWGFRLSGGRDYQQPLTVSRVTVGTIADAQLKTGDTIQRISEYDTSYMTQAQANDAIKNAGNLLQLVITKGGVGQFSPQPQQTKQFPTRLDRQLSDIENHTFSPPVTPQYDYNTQPTYGGGAPPAPPPPPPNQPPQAPAYMRPVGGFNAPNPKPTQQFNRPAPNSPPQSSMPDAVMNMAAKGPPGKKPFSYTPDVTSIQEQRDKVRKKTGNIPKYQNMLNLPNFDDAPVRQPGSPQQQPQQPSLPDNLPAGPGEGTFVHAQFNSPLQLYSDDNVAKAFEGQTGGLVSGAKRGPGAGQGDKDITMSPTYRLLHGLDANKPRPKVHIPQPAPNPNMLAPDDVGNYDETSIRYRGRNIPSKSFRMLQDMTGGPADTGMPEGTVIEEHPQEVNHVPHTQPGPTETPADIAADRRRRRRQKQPETKSPGSHGFDNQDPMVNGAVQPEPVKVLKGRSKSQDRLDEGDRPRIDNFDEQAFLQGRIPVMGNEAKPFARATSVQQERPVKEGDRPQIDYYDEEAFLAGRIPIMGGEARPFNRGESMPELPQGPDYDSELSRKHEMYDERDFLAGKISLFGDAPQPRPEKAPVQRELAPWEKIHTDDEDDLVSGRIDEEKILEDRKRKVSRTKAPWERSEDEEEHVVGRVSQVRGGTAAPLPPSGRRRKPKPKPIHDDMEHPTAGIDYNEADFLAGKINILRSSVDRELPPREARRPSQDVRPTWSREEDEESDFDESEYLRGRIPLLRQSVDRELPPREYEKKKVFRERAPWERPDPEDGEQNGGYDENAFLGRRPPIRPSDEGDSSRSGSESRGPPGRKMVVLRRSESRDRSPSRDSNFSNEDEEQPVKKMEYKGGAIPSKAFARLQRGVNRMAMNSPEDNMQRLRERARSDSASLDIDDAINNLKMDGADPEQYMQNLKKSMQQKDIKVQKIVAEEEVTDF